MNTNRDYLIVCDVKNSTIAMKRVLDFYVTDKNTSNIFISLVTQVSNEADIHEYVDIENAENYVVFMRIVKPNGNVKTIKSKLLRENSLFLVDLPEDYINIAGDYLCELSIHSTVDGVEEITTSNSFVYTANPSIITGLEVDVEENEDVIQELMERVEALEAKISSTGGNVDLSDYASKQFVEFAIASEFQKFVHVNGNYVVFTIAGVDYYLFADIQEEYD